MFRNEGPSADGRWRFTERAAAAGVTEPLNSFSAMFFDYDNDGHQDLYVSGFAAMAEDVAADYLGLPTTAERPRLYRNRGDGTFEDVTRAAGLYRVMPAMGLNFGDLDNDGFLDFYVGTGNPDLATLVPNRMFRNDGGKRFQDVTTAGDFGHLQKGHGIAFGDIDDDGDQDVFEQMGGAVTTDTAHSVLFANPGNGNAWVELTLEGVRSNRSAIGARIAVTVEGPSGRRLIHHTVGSGGSFGASPLRQHIGLGDARRVVSVEVAWPATGPKQAMSGLEARHRYRAVEGEIRLRSADRERSGWQVSASRPAAGTRPSSRARSSAGRAPCAPAPAAAPPRASASRDRACPRRSPSSAPRSSGRRPATGWPPHEARPRT
jgi:hypothetical protein